MSWAQASGRSPAVGSSPIDVGPLLRERLHERVPCVVFTSATLTTGGDFRFVKRRLGIEREVSEELVESPFRYEEQAALYAPQHLPDPRASDFPDAAVEEIVELIRMSKGGAFVLSTSLRMMRILAKRVGEQLDYEWFVQGDAPKQTLLDRFRDQGNAVCSRPRASGRASTYRFGAAARHHRQAPLRRSKRSGDCRSLRTPR